MKDRDRLLASAALVFSGAFALRAVESSFRLADILGTPHLAGVVVAECLSILQFLVLSLASFFAAQAFFSRSENRGRGLRDAAGLLATAYGFGLLSVAFTAGVDFSESHSSAYRVAAVLEGVFLLALMTTALLAAFGFSQRERARRDYLLGCSGIAFGLANLVALAGGVLRSEGYTGLHGLSTLTFGLNLGTTALVAAAVAGAIAAFAFFDAWARASASDSSARRDLLLTAAAGAYAFFAVIFFVSEAIVAIADSGLGYSGAGVTSSWIAVLASLASCAAVAGVMAALQPGFARALQRLRSAGLSAAAPAKGG